MHQVVEIEEKDVIQKIELFANYLSPTDLKRNLKKKKNMNVSIPF